jgi:hypothetical protein
VSNWEQFGDWVATIAVASLMWASGLVAHGSPAGLPAASASVPAADQPSSIMRWAQQDDEPPVEQVGEDTADDVETLDEAAPPAEEAETAGNAGAVETAEDIELLDQGPPVGAQVDDVELLDQGPPSTAGAVPAPSAVTTIPTTTYVAPVAASGPVVPEGFGTGQVHVATGSAGFPVGLEGCHVGAVTGRAYVGVDCGEGGGNSFVGHAPSFEEFPFVLDENFPFDRESVFANRGESELAGEVETLISAARGAPLDDEDTAPEIRTSGASSVAFEQRARDRKPRAEADNGRAKQDKKARRGGSDDQTASQAQDEVDRASAQSEHKKKKRGKDGDQDRSAKDDKKAKNSNNGKKHGGKKGKKHRSRK